MPRHYDSTYCHYCQSNPCRPNDGYCSDDCKSKARQKDYNRYHGLCTICCTNKKRTNSPYCSERCERIAEDTKGVHVKRNPAHNKATIMTPRCPECGELISATKDCRCP
jgi:hypothetical protein